MNGSVPLRELRYGFARLYLIETVQFYTYYIQCKAMSAFFNSFNHNSNSIVYEWNGSKILFMFDLSSIPKLVKQL